jgi:hypothetical protein
VHASHAGLYLFTGFTKKKKICSLVGWRTKMQPNVLTTKNVYFVKLSKCVTDFTIAFLSSRWSKNIYRTANLGSG